MSTFSINHISVGTRYSGSWYAPKETLDEAWDWFHSDQDAYWWARDAKIGDKFDYVVGVYFERVE